MVLIGISAAEVNLFHLIVAPSGWALFIWILSFIVWVSSLGEQFNIKSSCDEHEAKDWDPLYKIGIVYALPFWSWLPEYVTSNCHLESELKIRFFAETKSNVVTSAKDRDLWDAILCRFAPNILDIESSKKINFILKF